jgi:hypothetical protein
MTIEWPRGLKSSLLQTFGPTGIVNEKVYDNDTLGKNVVDYSPESL